MSNDSERVLEEESFPAKQKFLEKYIIGFDHVTRTLKGPRNWVPQGEIIIASGKPLRINEKSKEQIEQVERIEYPESP